MKNKKQATTNDLLLKAVQTGLRSNLFPNKSKYYDISLYESRGTPEKLRRSWVSEKCLDNYFRFNDIFNYFISSVVVFSKKGKREPILVFKALGRVLGELQITHNSGLVSVRVYPFIIFSNGQFRASWPAELKNEYPAITTPVFWQGLDKYSEVREISLSLIKDSAYDKSFNQVKRVMRYLGVLPERRGSSKPKDDYDRFCRVTVISEYKRLCNDNPKYRLRIPIEKLSKCLFEELDKIKTINSKSDEAHNPQTIRRWIDEHDAFARMLKNAKNVTGKDGAMILSGKIINIPLHCDLLCTKSSAINLPLI